MTDHNTPHWKKALLPIGSTLRQAIQNLDESTLQIVLVVSEDGTLLGTLTDGDIRRGLLRGLDLDSPIDSIIHEDPLVAPPEMDKHSALQVMQVNRVRQLPVVDKNRKVIDLYLLKELLQPKHRPSPMVIMAGGKGTRLRPHTENCPKPLLPVGGKPMLEHIIERAKAEGLTDIILAIHYLGHMIEDYFGDGSKWGVHISYLREDKPLGTAGALNLLDPRPSVPFLVTNGDVLTEVRYGEVLDFHMRNNAQATMAVSLYEWQHPYGVVRTNGVNITGFEEKPVYRTHINAGVYVLSPEAIELIPEGSNCDMPDLFQNLINQEKKAIVYPIHEHWLDVGRLSDFEQAGNYICDDNR